ncbi:MAG: triose-phosphate isomerase [Elusimicrobiota bacterium]|jgi:triosephosphate isomerase
MRKPLIAGNFKMYKTISETHIYAKGLRAALASVADREVAVCPPFTALAAVAEELRGSPIAWGSQNVHWEKQGAFTGEISAEMLKELGCRFAIAGHSERRQYFGETDQTVNKRMHAVLVAGITPIVCIGETLQEREANTTFSVVERQMKNGLQGLVSNATIVIAYEPVWAIGTGKTATPAQAQEVHAFIRSQLAKTFGDTFAKLTRVLYGGSVKPDNMSALMSQPDIDGGLVGGACLDVESFSKIVRYQ